MCEQNEVYTRVTLETCYPEGEIVSASVCVNRCDLSVEELLEPIRGVLLASYYDQDSIDAALGGE